MKTILLTFTCLLVLTATVNAQTTPPADSLKAYVGTYTLSAGSPISKFVITVDKGELYGAADDNSPNKLIKQPLADTFKSTSSYGSIITFLRDTATKAVRELTLAVQGTELSAKKNTP